MNDTTTTVPAPAGQRCGCCGLVFSILVDDSNLCIRCDAVLFPNRSAA